MRPTLRQLQYFEEIAQSRSFSLAAKSLGVSQPALSSQFSEMEETLGVKLIERRKRGLLLTEAGETALRFAKKILAETESMKEALRMLTAPFTGNIKIGVLPSIGAYFLPDATRQLHAKYPDLRFQITESGTIALETSVCAGENDIVISTYRPNPDLKSVHLFNESLWISTAVEDELMTETGPIELSELKGRTLINLGDGFGLSQTIEYLARRAGAKVSRQYRGQSLDAARQMAVMGAGIAIMPSLYALTEAKRDTAFNVRRIDYPDAINPISLIWRKTHPKAAVFETLAADLIAVKQGMAHHGLSD